MKLGRGLVAMTAVLASAAAWVTACTGDDPTLSPSATDASDAPANPPPPPPGGGDGGGDADAGATKPLVCSFEYSVPVKVTDSTSGTFNPKSLRIFSNGADTTRVIVSRTSTGNLELWTQDVNGKPPKPAVRNTLGTNVNGDPMDLKPMVDSTGFVGEAVFLNESAGLAVYEIPNSAQNGDGGPIAADRIAVKASDGTSYYGGRIVQIQPSDYLYVVAHQLAASSYELACGRASAGSVIGPNQFAAFATDPGRDGNPLVHATTVAGGSYFIHNRGDFTTAPVAYRLTDTCSSAGSAPTTSFKSNSDGGAFIVGAKRAENTDDTFSLFLIDIDTSFTMETFTEGRATASDLAGGVDLSLAPPAFAEGPTFGLTEAPFGSGSGAAMIGDRLAIAGTSITGGEGNDGVNFAIIGVDGTVIARRTGTNALFAGEGRPVVSTALGDDPDSPIVSVLMAWIEAPDDGGTETLYVNRLYCTPAP